MEIASVFKIRGEITCELTCDEITINIIITHPEFLYSFQKEIKITLHNMPCPHFSFYIFCKRISCLQLINVDSVVRISPLQSADSIYLALLQTVSFRNEFSLMIDTTDWNLQNPDSVFMEA